MKTSTKPRRTSITSDAAVLFFRQFPLIGKYLQDMAQIRGHLHAEVVLDTLMGDRKLAQLREESLQASRGRDYVEVLVEKPEEERTEREKMYIAKRQAQK